MKKLLLKTAFVIAVTFVTLVLLVPTYPLLEALDPSDKGGDRLLPGVVMIFGCLFAADRITSVLFGRSGLSDKRWSLLSRRTLG